MSVHMDYATVRRMSDDQAAEWRAWLQAVVGPDAWKRGVRSITFDDSTLEAEVYRRDERGNPYMVAVWLDNGEEVRSHQDDPHATPPVDRNRPWDRVVAVDHLTFPITTPPPVTADACR